MLNGSVLLFIVYAVHNARFSFIQPLVSPLGGSSIYFGMLQYLFTI